MEKLPKNYPDHRDQKLKELPHEIRDLEKELNLSREQNLNLDLNIDYLEREIGDIDIKINDLYDEINHIFNINRNLKNETGHYSNEMNNLDKKRYSITNEISRLKREKYRKGAQIINLWEEFSKSAEKEDMLSQNLYKKQMEYGVPSSVFEVEAEGIVEYMKKNMEGFDTCKFSIMDPLVIDWSQTKKEPQSITLNPETIRIPYDSGKPFTPDLSAFHGRSLTELLQHIQKNYGKTHYLPGLEFNQFLHNNPWHISEDLKNGKSYILPGSSVGFIDGEAGYAFGIWNDSFGWLCGSGALGDSPVDSETEVILFER